MMSLEQIQKLSQEAAEKAAKEKQVPYMIFEQGEINNMPPFPFPFLGSYDPPSWTQTDEYFVDSSGFGSPDEPALTMDQFKEVLKPGKGYAILETGQFQVWVGEYIKDE